MNDQKGLGGRLHLAAQFSSRMRNLRIFSLEHTPERASAMFQGFVPHHNTGGFTSHRKFLGDKEYGEALDSIVKACSDLLLQSPDGTKVFVGKRLVHPQPDWWFVGGRIFPGETPVQSCCRLLRRELSLEIEPSRFQTVCCQSLAWGMRQQLPMTNGTTDSQVVLSLRRAPRGRGESADLSLLLAALSTQTN